MAVAKAPKSPKAPKSKAPTTHTHRCLAQGGHTWEHASPCDGPKFRTRLCQEHQTPINGDPAPAPEVTAELAAEPIVETPAPEAKLPLTPLRPDHAPKLKPLQLLMQPVVEKSRRQAGAYVGYIKTFPVGAKAYFRLVSDGELTQEAALTKAQAAIASHVKAGTIPVRYAEELKQAKAPAKAAAK